jgi:putative membrane protein insertion efficiency factor
MLINQMLNSRPAALLVHTLALVNQALGQVLLGLVRLYQLTLSPFIGNQCRFHPTCSHYAMDAVRCHGPWIGTGLAAKRLARCHPFADGGVDPVPEKKSTQAPNPMPSRGLPPVPPHVKEAL